VKQLLLVVASLEKRGKKEEINQEAETKGTKTRKMEMWVGSVEAKRDNRKFIKLNN